MLQTGGFGQPGSFDFGALCHVAGEGSPPTPRPHSVSGEGGGGEGRGRHTLVLQRATPTRCPDHFSLNLIGQNIVT